jgi:deoxyribodipyrimidine photo-lyase
MQTKLPETALPVIDITIPTLIYNSYNLDPLWRPNEHVNRILLLEPSHFEKYPVSEKVIMFIMGLSKNLPNAQIYCGEFTALESLYEGSEFDPGKAFIAKEHPAFQYYPGSKDSRDWIYPEVSGYYSSFSSYWKKCEKYLK